MPGTICPANLVQFKRKLWPCQLLSQLAMHYRVLSSKLNLNFKDHFEINHHGSTAFLAGKQAQACPMYSSNGFGKVGFEQPW